MLIINLFDHQRRAWCSNVLYMKSHRLPPCSDAFACFTFQQSLYLCKVNTYFFICKLNVAKYIFFLIFCTCTSVFYCGASLFFRLLAGKMRVADSGCGCWKRRNRNILSSSIVISGFSLFVKKVSLWYEQELLAKHTDCTYEKQYLNDAIYGLFSLILQYEIVCFQSGARHRSGNE